MSVETVHSAQVSKPSSGNWSKLRKIGHYVLASSSFGLVVLLVVTAIGFFRFTDRVAHLSLPVETEQVEAIVVLTGGYQRIDTAVDLLERGVGKRLLISGVNPATSGSAIKRATGANGELFSCCVDIGYQAIDTIGNAHETAGWIRKFGYKNILVVTNNYHIPRSLIELETASPDVEFVGYPVSNTDLKTETWMTDPIAVRTLVTEYLKYALTKLRSWTGTEVAHGLRADMPKAGSKVSAVMVH